MKEHDCRILKIGEIYYAFYVDSNNYLHNLHGRAMTIDDVHYIHGRYYNKKEWLIEREVLLLEDNREEILNQI